MGNFSDRHHCQKVCVYGGTDGRRGGSSLLPWGHGIWKAHRRLHSSTASPAAMTPTKPLPRVFCVRKPWYTENGNSELEEEHLTNMNIYDFWKAVLGQNEIEIRKYFQNDAYINWHCTNERFNVDEFIIANCEYPGDWEGSVERVETLNDLIVTVVNVYPKGRNASFHVTSFIKTKEDKIVSMDEYWADDGNAPQWRLDKHIGKAIR
ncbi:Uncharacterised protein [Faecalibacterium prausnitzii]|nr:Uncharacterised protein [Faecalibacterium prausnitzii]